MTTLDVLQKQLDRCNDVARATSIYYKEDMDYDTMLFKCLLSIIDFLKEQGTEFDPFMEAIISETRRRASTGLVDRYASARKLPGDINGAG